MTVRGQARLALRAALERMPSGPAARDARVLLERRLADLAAPLRVALAGRVSSGKSTLVNALVGAPVAATGRHPVTFAVSVLRYADTPSWTVHRADGTSRSVDTAEQLAACTARAENGRAPARVDHVEGLGPYACLRQFELVDTPGFDSPHTEDTEEAMRAVGATRASVAAASADRLRTADAVVLVLNGDVTGADAELLRRLHDPDGAGFTPNPATSMAVLTKVERLWPGEIGEPVRDPRDVAERHARRIMRAAESGRMFHSVLPVCGKVAAAAAGLTEEDLHDLSELARVGPALLDRRLRHLSGFLASDDLPVDPGRRRELAARLSRYGVSLACRLVLEGADRPAALRRELEEHSGLNRLRTELAERFAARSGLIKTARMIDEVRAAPGLLSADASDRDRDLTSRAVESVLNLRHTEPGFAEFDLLRRYYAGALPLSASVADELRRAAGEHGTSAAARLGLPADAGPEQLQRTALARLAHWSDPLTGTVPGGRAPAAVLRRRYQELYERAGRARIVLGEDTGLDGGAVPGEGTAPGADGPAEPADGSGPLLVVDLGTTTSSALLLTDGRSRLLKEPGTGRDWWPTAVYDDGDLHVGTAAEARRAEHPPAYRTEFKPEIGSGIPVLHGPAGGRTAEDLAVAVLAAFRDRAAEFGPAPVRLLVTVPVGTTGGRREAMLRAGARAGFGDVELLPEPLAAAFAPTARDPWPSGSTVLVYDLGGGTFDAALVRIDADGCTVLGTSGLPEGGRDVDAAIAADLWPAVESWLDAVPDRARYRDAVARRTLAAAAELKQRLAAERRPTVEIVLGLPPQGLDRERLAELTSALMAGTVDRCHALIAEAGLEPEQVDGVLLAGGSSQLPVVLPHLERHLGVAGPIRRAADPVLAVVTGAAAWAAGAAARRAADDEPQPQRVPLAWTLPGGRATLVRWLVEPAQTYPAGAVLTRVRLADDSLFDLTARTGGRLLQQHVWPGGRIYSGSWLATALRPAAPADLLAGPVPRRRVPGRATALAIGADGRRITVVFRDSPDRSVLAVFDADTGAELRRSTIDGRVTALARPVSDRRLVVAVSGPAEGAHTVRVLDLLDPRAAHARPGPDALREPRAEQPAAVLALAPLPGDHRVALLRGDGMLMTFDIRTGAVRPLAELEGRPAALAADPDGRWAAVGGGDDVSGMLHLVDTATGARSDLPWLPSRVRALAFAGGRSAVLAGGGVPGEGVLAFCRPDHRPVPVDRVPDQQVRAVRVSADGELFAAATPDGEVRIGAVRTGEVLATVRYDGAPASVEFSPDGHLLFVAGDTGLAQWALTGHDPPPPPSPEVGAVQAPGAEQEAGSHDT